MHGVVIWLTGLPASGKSMLAGRLAQELRGRGHRLEMLDGDEMRRQIGRELGFSKADRDENIRRIGFVAKLLAQHGVTVITAAIAPYRAVRDELRREIGNFVEVYLKCPVEECARRDPKGMYKMALTGELPNFTGISDPYEPPLSPELVLETDKETIEESLTKLLGFLEQSGHLDAVSRP